MLNFCDIIQVFVFTTNHHLKTYRIGQVSHLLHAALVNVYTCFLLNSVWP